MSSEWIDWEGGDCPVDGDALVCIRLASGWESEPCRAGGWSADRWAHSLGDHNIIAYKIYKQDQDPRKEWVKIKEGCMMPGCKQECVIFDVDGDCQFDCEYQGDGIFVENTEGVVFTINDCQLYWRHRHPDPED